jgi:tetratricopeptide (TPR) repeat protein
MPAIPHEERPLRTVQIPGSTIICIRLDGLPLAIELAAAQIRLFAPAALLARLTHRLDVLIDGAADLPDRHRTLRDAIAWSYALLPPDIQRCFRWSALFVGGWTPERATALCATAGEAASALPQLTSLVRASLIRAEADDGQTRFAMLETIRDYALEQLAASGELAVARARYAENFLAWVTAIDVTLTGPDQHRSVRALTEEHDNIRAALRWAQEECLPEVGVPLAVALSRFWEMQGHLSEGRAWLEAFLALSGDGEGSVTDLDRAKALNSAGIFAYRLRDYPHAAARLEESIAMFRMLGETRRVAAALNNLGNVAKEQGDYRRADLLHRESLDLKREMGDPRGIAASLNNLGMIASARGDDEAAIRLYAEAALLQRQGDDRWVLSHTLNNWGEVMLRHGDNAGAVACFRESLTLKRQLGDWWGSVLTLNNLGRAAMLRGDNADAVTCYRESLALCEATDDAVGLPTRSRGWRGSPHSGDKPSARRGSSGWPMGYAECSAMPSRRPMIPSVTRSPPLHARRSERKCTKRRGGQAAHSHARRRLLKRAPKDDVKADVHVPSLQPYYPEVPAPA